MVPVGARLWKLSSGGAGSLGLSCTEAGLFLGGTALVERRELGYELRPAAELEHLLARAYGGELTLDRVLRGCQVVAAALEQGNLCLAQIAALHLRIPDLSDELARGRLEAEDRLIKGGRDGDWLARNGWDPDKHPRAGVSPNPGWFAPADGGQSPMHTAQREEDERAPEEMLDPIAPVRQAQWDAAIATLRQIDPTNPHLTYVANPRSAPSQEALDRLNEAVEAAAIKRVTDKVMPGGLPIGQPGTSTDIRVLSGGSRAATDLFEYLRVGGTVYKTDSNMTIIQLPGKSGFITYRHSSRSGDPAIDINVPGVVFDKIHFFE